MKFSVFTASTPEWSPAEAAAKLSAQGWDGIEWRVTDQPEAAEPGFVEDFSTEVPLADRTAGNLNYVRRAAELAGIPVRTGVAT
jgi:sugar phosphate isomerase/epimerase